MLKEIFTPGDTMYKFDNTIERREILSRYRYLLRTMNLNEGHDHKHLLRRSLNIALDAHKGARRRSGEPYIYHPMEVAQIVAGEIGLDETSVICAVLHDVVEDSEYTLEDIRGLFGGQIARIIDGLTKINEIGIFDQKEPSAQAANFRRLLLTLSDDVRVILIKLADRLHNMRTLSSMKAEKQLKIAAETTYLYAPLAHRLGLYNMKSELEDLALKYTEPEVYENISRKLIESVSERKQFVREFITPVKKELDEKGFKYRILDREKSIASIWNKMNQKEIPFEEVYDLFAVRIIIDTPMAFEKVDCWRVYSIITDHYSPRQDRLRDWMSTPKANGYEALHTTVMSHQGRWVEVQIRSERMNEVAEKGYAAHWKYKEKSNNTNSLDRWLNRIKQLLDSPDPDAINFLDEFKLNLFSDEIFVFTPKGDLKTLPAKSTALDFGYSIHSEIGNQCIGAKVNHRLVPLNYELKNGDQVEIITSKKQVPKEEWLDNVVTARAKSLIKEAIKEAKREHYDSGRKKLEGIFKALNLDFNKTNLSKFQRTYKIYSRIDLYYKVSIGEIGVKEVKNCCQQHEKSGLLNYIRKPRMPRLNSQRKAQASNNNQEPKEKTDALVLNGDFSTTKNEIAACCNPIPGDEAIGFISPNNKIIIHRTNCPEAIQLGSRFGNRIIKARWSNEGIATFLTGLKISGFEKMNLIHELSRIITQQHQLSIQNFRYESKSGISDVDIMLYVQDTKQLHHLILDLKKIKDIKKVSRINKISASLA
ncbi:MAG: RelA/SpoT family protein [Bacteroidales bacterium]|nr:RelA/SpoT family protein [Bacteroidales bacterium]